MDKVLKIPRSGGDRRGVRKVFEVGVGKKQTAIKGFKTDRKTVLRGQVALSTSSSQGGAHGAPASSCVWDTPGTSKLPDQLFHLNYLNKYHNTPDFGERQYESRT